MKHNLQSWLRLLVLLLDDALIVSGVLLVMWLLDVRLQPSAVVFIAVAAAALIFLMNKAMSPLFLKPARLNPGHVVGLEGTVVRALTPEGVVKVRGEMWTAVVAEGEANVGQRVKVTGIGRLKLTVMVVPSRGPNRSRKEGS